MKIGLIGCGKQAVKHIGGLKKCPGVEIVLADKYPDLARSLGEQQGLAWVEEVDRLIGDSSISAVDLCVPTPFHAPLIRQSLAAGKDFFCEKPLCEAVAEAHEINELAANSARVGMVGYVYRYAPVFQKAAAILAGARETGTSEALGKVSLALMRIGGRGSAAVWKHRRDTGGGAINEMLVHMLDLAVWYFGPIERIEAVSTNLLRPERVIEGRLESADAEDFVLARMVSRSGVPIVIQGDMVTPSFTQMIEVQGDNGTLMASIQPEMPQFLFALKAAAGYPAGRTTLPYGNANLFDVQMAAFVTAVRDRRNEAGGTLAGSVEVMSALEMVKEAAQYPGH